MSAVDALQTALRAEHAALYVYGTLGAQTSASAQPALYDAVSAAYVAHRGRRDLLVRTVRGLGATPAASAPSYVVPRRLGTPQEVRRAALELERACAETYAWVVANTVGEHRRWAAGALNDAAVRELAFRGTPEMLPGADEYTDR